MGENKDAIFKKTSFSVPSSLVKEIEEVFSERRKFGGFEDGFIRMSSKTTREILDHSKEREGDRAFFQYVSNHQVTWKGDIEGWESWHNFGRLDSYFLDLRSLLKTTWWKVGKNKQEQRLEWGDLIRSSELDLVAKGKSSGRRVSDETDLLERALSQKYTWFDDLMTTKNSDGFFREKIVSPSCSGNVLVDTKLCIYLLFVYHFEGFRTAYLRSVTEDTFGAKDVDTFTKVCKKFIKSKINNTPLETFVCRFAWEPEEELSFAKPTRQNNWSKSEKKARNAFNEMLCQFFIHMTEFCVENEFTFGATDESHPQTDSNGTKKKQSTAEKGKDFELLCMTILESKGWKTTGTSASGDQGADIIAERGPIKLVIQCKDYQGNVGNGAVQEVHAAKSFYEGSLAAIVCTKNYTKSAQSLAKNVGVLLWHVSDLENL